MKKLHVLLAGLFIWSGGYAQELVKFSEGGKFGFCDKATDKMVVAPKYDQANNFSDGLAAVSRNREWGYIDKTGNEVIPLIYVIAGDFSEGLAPVSLEAFGNRGFINQKGEIVIPLRRTRIILKVSFLVLFVRGDGAREQKKNIKNFQKNEGESTLPYRI